MYVLNFLLFHSALLLRAFCDRKPLLTEEANSQLEIIIIFEIGYFCAKEKLVKKMQ
jgi:hypothetical protein